MSLPYESTTHLSGNTETTGSLKMRRNVIFIFPCYVIESGYVCRIHDNPLEYTSFGKPNPSVFKNAEDVLKEIATSTRSHSNQGSHHFKTLYMVGDNPKIDIRGARQVLCFFFFQSRGCFLATDLFI